MNFYEPIEINTSEKNDGQSTKSFIQGPQIDYNQTSICSVLLDQFLVQGCTPVLLAPDGKTIHTYSSILTNMSNLSYFLKNTCQIQPSACIGLLIDDLSHSIVSALAVLFTGLTLTILDIENPYARLESICKRDNIQVLIYSRSHFRYAHCLLWSCSCLSTIICIDENNNHHDHLELALSKTDLWNAKVLSADDDDRIAGGWMNAYDGSLFTHTEMAEFANNVFEHLRPFLHKDCRVLEIGCGSGFTARVIAPHVGQYVATDSSPYMTDYLRCKLNSPEWSMITFDTVSAEKIIEHFPLDSKFNIIILNSVVHCFPTHEFLTDVLQQCLRLLDPVNGILFIGDVMDLEKRDEMLDSLYVYQQENPSYKVELDWYHVLFLSRLYFTQFCQQNGVNVCFLPKIGKIENELTRYSYDVIISMSSSTTPTTTFVPSKVSYTTKDFLGKGSIDELIRLSRSVTFDTNVYMFALHKYVDYARRMFHMSETTVIPLFMFDLPFVLCALSSGAKMIIFDSFERSHQTISNCNRLTLAKFTRQQLATILDDAHSPLSLSTIVLVGISENSDELLFTRLKRHQDTTNSITLFKEYCFNGCLDTQTNEIFCRNDRSKYILNGQYIDLLEIERTLERLPCIRKVWITIVSHENQDHIQAVYLVDDNAAVFKNILWLERLITYGKIYFPSYLIPSIWARVESNIIHTTNNINQKNKDEKSFSFEDKIQRLVQNILHMDHLPDLHEDFFPERRIYTVLSHRLVEALKQERSDYTHSHLFEHRTLQDVIDYLQKK